MDNGQPKVTTIWHTLALTKLKLAKRHLERIWSHTHSFEDLENLHSAINYYHAAIINAKQTYNSFLISSSSTNPRQLWKNINILLHCSSLPALPSHDSLSLLCQSCANFFSDKLHSLLINCISTFPHYPPPFNSTELVIPSLVLPLIRFLNSCLILLTLIVISILFLHLS